MNEKRFVAKQVEVVDEDEIELLDIVFDTEDTYAFMVRDIDTASGLCDLLNEQQEEIDYLKDLISAMKLDIKNAMQMVSRWNDE